MLAAPNRMRRSGDFTETMRQGRRGSGGTVSVHLKFGLTEDPALVGFVVSKAVGGSVVRHRVQRRLRHLVRERVSDLPGGTRVVVRAHPAAATASSDELARDLSRAIWTASGKAARP